jgi:hypothetical protein
MKELMGHEVEMSLVEERIIARFAEVFAMEHSHEHAARQSCNQKGAQACVT